MAARYPSSSASTRSAASGTGLELVRTSGNTRRGPPMAKKPHTYLCAAPEGPLTLSYGNIQVMTGRRDLKYVAYARGTDEMKRSIWTKLGLDEQTASNTKILGAFWPEGADDAEWKEIDFRSCDELWPFVHEICVVDRD
ncbi:hypothetical protein EV121DRAFT_284262 [Schizophyllum commune]